MTVLAANPGGQQRRRGGFTLVEMLVTMAIIAILVAVTGGAYLLVLKTQRQNATQTLIAKLTTALESQKKAVVDQVRQESLDPVLVAAANGDTRQALTMQINQRLAQEFPTDFSTAAVKYGKYIIGKNVPPNEQSSVLLYLALSRSRSGSTFNPDTALDSGSVVTRPDGLKVIVDAWGKPLIFKGVVPAPMIESTNGQ